LSANDTRFGMAPLKLVNDLDFDGDEIYAIDSSFEREVNEAVEEHIEANARGRLFRYNEKKNELEILLANLYFPNGLQLMPDKESILINENSMARILRHFCQKKNLLLANSKYK
jgi:sugar lactone lactonase YvrE